MGGARDRLLHRPNERITIVIQSAEELLVRLLHDGMCNALDELRIIGLAGALSDGAQMAAIDKYDDIGWHGQPPYNEKAGPRATALLGGRDRARLRA